MSLVFRFAARSDAGAVRPKNDDSGYAGRYFAVVADGMGGHAGGDVASASTVLDLAHLDTHGFADPDTVLPDEIQTANAFLSKLVGENPKLAGMGTTITSLLVTGDRLQFAHIGDSRAYRLKKGRFRQVSKDHTFVQRLVDEGRLNPDEAEFHPHKNVLMRVLGDVDASPELDITSFPLEAGERWLLCSDGLNAVVSDRLIEQKLRSPQSLESIVEELVDLTIEGGAPDNVTVLCVEVVEAGEGDLTPSRGLPLSRRAVAAAGRAPGEEEADVGLASSGLDDMDDAHDADDVDDDAARPAAESTAAGGDEAGGEAGSETMELVPVVNAGALAGHAPDADDELSPLSAAMLDQSHRARPHLLVGAAAQATETGMIPVVPRNVDEHPMAVLLNGQPLIPVRHTYSEMLDEHRTGAGSRAAAEGGSGAGAGAGAGAESDAGSDDDGDVASDASSDDSDGASVGAAAPARESSPDAGETTGADERSAERRPDDADRIDDLDDLDEEEMALAAGATTQRRRRAWFLPTFVTLLTLLLAAVLFLGYVWTQTQYYVGEEDGEVAVFNGVSQSLGPIRLSEADEHVDIAVDDLSPYHQERVRRGIPADDRRHAESIVTQLRGTLPEDAPGADDPDRRQDGDRDAGESDSGGADGSDSPQPSEESTRGASGSTSDSQDGRTSAQGADSRDGGDQG
ncbi:PP2C family serine/threonine-protein phosphatase [Nesterenkonia sp. F]|uniref:PP2C family protein-serine/threonine phosphatase n=1 Tax=Nesterenkonia sp. F TaxID=795955 RepID=UPI000255D299|nr:protein phosphatase 2C domain-containing protein [Nesterenkonia sp. F]